LNGPLRRPRDRAGARRHAFKRRTFSVNISKPLQRTLHALARGGQIVLDRDPDGDIRAAECWTREGWLLSDCDLAVFQSLRRKRLIASRDGKPYRITREGLLSLRSQLDNRVSSRGW
jgi:uncharacterized protein